MPDLGAVSLSSPNTFIADQTFQGGLTTQAFLRLESSICPAQITSDQNDYNPTGLSTTVRINLNGDSSFRTITGPSRWCEWKNNKNM